MRTPISGPATRLSRGKALLVIERALMSGRPIVPDQSNSVVVATLRYIQSLYEAQEYRNPDTFVRDLLSPPRRWLGALQAKLQLTRLQANPFYFYLVARTRYYDQIFRDAISDNINFIINIGCGTDTRAYRFAEELREKRISVLECDQPQSIYIKQRLAKRKWYTGHVTYVSIDLNDSSWPNLQYQLVQIPSAALVVLEGVSNYIAKESFTQFLKFIAAKLHVGSRVAYDYKIQRIADDDQYSCSGSRKLFRLPAAKKDIVAFHQALGYELKHMELSSDLSLRLLPDIMRTNARLYAEDCLLQLIVAQN
jgi:methyltransferase (TIGR00027 family)